MATITEIHAVATPVVLTVPVGGLAPIATVNVNTIQYAGPAMVARINVCLKQAGIVMYGVFVPGKMANQPQLVNIPECRVPTTLSLNLQFQLVPRPDTLATPGNADLVVFILDDRTATYMLEATWTNAYFFAFAEQPIPAAVFSDLTVSYS